MPLIKRSKPWVWVSEIESDFYRQKAWRDFRMQTWILTLPHPPVCGQRPDGDLIPTSCNNRLLKDSSKAILDHVVPRSQGGPDYPDVTGLRWYCISCHSKKTMAEQVFPDREKPRR